MLGTRETRAAFDRFGNVHEAELLVGFETRDWHVAGK